ncbi:MAG: hypothetical protein SFU99_10990 [Saprospiraceae bacterium]|nr:hypothetical protein [Saprospiraceae bacterium]
MRFSLVFLVLLIASGQASSQSFALSEYFQSMKISDTLFFSMTSPSGMKAKPIPYSVFTTNVELTLQQNIDYMLDAEETKILGLTRFRLSDEYDAYLIGVTLFWYGNQSLLVVNKKHNYVTALIPVSNFYGGDGGQMLRNSWLFDFDGDGDKDILIRDSSHTLRVNEEGEGVDSYEEFVSLYIWEPTGFKPKEVKDSKALINRFKVNWDW